VTRISIVIFDCDGVLVDSEILALQVELAALAELGLPCEIHQHMARFLGMTGAEWYSEIGNDYLRTHGRPLPANFRSRCQQQYRTAMENVMEVAGARTFVAKIACRKAVASSSSLRSLENKLRRTEMWGEFAPHIYSAEQVGHGKPAPDLFLHVARRMGVEPGSCLVIEDSAHGVTAARAAGMRVWGFIGGGHLKASSGEHLLGAGAERIIEHWLDDALICLTPNRRTAP